MRILIADDYAGAVPALACFQRLQGHEVRVLRTGLAQAPAETLAWAEALVLIRERSPVDATLLQAMPALRLISQTGKLAGHVDVAACAARGG